MKGVDTLLIITGIILAISGIIFSLQSKSIVGPASSFMYNNPEWTINGSIIVAIGIIAIATGGLIFIMNRSRK